MAKKIFCDVCGGEMVYANMAQYLKAQPELVTVQGCGNKTLKFEVAVRIMPTDVANGEHVDICGSCSAYLLDRLDVRTEGEREVSWADVQIVTPRI